MRFLGSLLCAVAEKGCCEEKERKLHFFFNTKLKQWFFSEPHLGQGGFFGKVSPGAPGAAGGCPSKHPACQAGKAISLCPHSPWGRVTPALTTPWGLGDLLYSQLILPIPAIPRACQHLLAHPCLPWTLAAPSPSLGEPGAHSCTASPALCFPW